MKPEQGKTRKWAIKSTYFIFSRNWFQTRRKSAACIETESAFGGLHTHWQVRKRIKNLLLGVSEEQESGFPAPRPLGTPCSFVLSMPTAHHNHRWPTCCPRRPPVWMMLAERRQVIVLYFCLVLLHPLRSALTPRMGCISPKDLLSLKP